MRIRATAVFRSLGALGCLLGLSSCFVVNVPLKIVGGTAKAGAQAASATKNAFTKSDEEKEKDAKKKEAKEAEAEKKKKEEELMKQQQQEQQHLPRPVSPPQNGTPPSSPQGQKQQTSPYTDKDYWKPPITPKMLKNGEYQPGKTPPADG